MAANAISDLALATNLSSIPREFFPDYEERTKPEFPSPIPSPLEYLLEKENGHAGKTEIVDDFCVLPSSYFKDDYGTYFISFPISTACATRDSVRAYVSPENPEPLIQDDCFEILPKLQPIRILDKCSRFEAHGKRGRKPFRPKQERFTIRRFLFTT